MNFQIFYSIDKRKTLKRKRKKGGAMVTIVQRAIIRQEASLEETLDFFPPSNTDAEHHFPSIYHFHWRGLTLVSIS